MVGQQMIAVFLMLLPFLAYVASNVRSGQDFVLMPSLVSVIFVTWLMPQLFFVQEQEQDIFIATTVFGLFGATCFIAIAAGFRMGARRRRRVSQVVQLSTPSVVLWSAISIFLNLQYLAAFEANREISQWSGSGTIIAFFSSIRLVVFPLSAIAFFRNPNVVLGAVLAANLYIVVQISFGELRRSDMISFILVLFLVYYFVRGRVPSLGFFTVTVPMAIIIVFSISELRNIQDTFLSEGRTAFDIILSGALRDIDFGSAVVGSVSFAPDVRNGSYIIAYCLETLDYRFGAELWNDLVWQYVPAQLVGASVKDALLVGERVSIYSDLLSYFNYSRSPGSTRTGIGSAFLDLGPMGFVYFFVIGWICGRVFSQAATGDLIAQAFYIALLAPVLISFTHSHTYFFTVLPLLITVAIGLRITQRFVFRRASAHRGVVVHGHGQGRTAR